MDVPLGGAGRRRPGGGGAGVFTRGVRWGLREGALEVAGGRGVLQWVCGGGHGGDDRASDQQHQRGRTVRCVRAVLFGTCFPPMAKVTAVITVIPNAGRLRFLRSPKSQIMSSK